MASKTENQPDPPQGAQLQKLAELQEAGFGNMVGLSTAWLEALGDIGSEVLSFMAERVKEDVKTQHAILHCKNVSELQNIQAEFIQKALEQYSAETGKLVRMSNDALASAGSDKN